jgi:hypothetical protein
VINEKRQQEERFWEFRNRIERQLTLQDQGLERLKNDIAQKPKEGDGRITAFQKIFHELRKIIDDIQNDIDLMQKPSGFSSKD